MEREEVSDWLRDHPLAVDAALAALLGLLLLPGSVQNAYDLVPAREVAAPVLVEVGALALRRVRPALSAALVFTGALAHYVLAVPQEAGSLLPSDVAVLLATYSVAAHGRRWARWTGLAAALLGGVLQGLFLLRTPGSAGWSDVAAALGFTGVIGAVVLLAWTAGQWRRTRREYVASLVDRARRADLEREQQAVIAAAEERARIARELHDIVAHSLSVIIAQADGGRYAAAASPGAAVGALETVSATGRAALTDMRRLLGVLREGEGAAMAPQPDAASVPELVAAVRESGLPVALVQTGAPRPLPPGAGLAVYRVVQEALTNVLKHAGPAARAQVRLHWTPSALEACIEDDGRGAAASAPDGVGRGLTGMQERMTLYGGVVEAGPRAGGGFAVRAVLPWADAAR